MSDARADAASRPRTSLASVRERLAKRAGRARRELITPEGVPITFKLADIGARTGAFFLDMLMIVMAIGCLLIALVLTGFRGGDWFQTIVILALFIARNFYFIFFELRWGGMTPGKKAFKIRVVDARGGHLTADAIFARNFLREVEFFMPATLLLGAPFLDVGGLIILGTLGWMVVITGLPLFNKDRMRAGDLIAGTWVVEKPKAPLLPDIADSQNADAQAATPDPPADRRYTFTIEQLDQYGIYELQTLEDVLRRGDGVVIQAIRAEVAVRVQKKIDWQGGTVDDPSVFLEDFYAALRARLEQRMLFGERREDKHYRGREE